ncbi:D-alanyl-lipoteichoic acid biosynthesis protein DltD [Lentilactobacillus hilgardii]|uniref:Protein DltD n=1 Tax=Lentilactobacillus hilgardii (strain ATCC 8290 / DSM 20176 / CCUG 30140 / JCM 1155 / KCTC 3500 / NBRC 15886 / NCIMB 8040 / NRRL B-1843 / 9) TaxID=1423757 RepID=C0XJP1_LENH9|nr:D-alanyl-lipoteichoic acid biosynthesis protein DltD [Lentilactobacillus hilgardii]EEI20499.1 DltD C-terminal domain protein [Lentilactobacillus buchneri ATCC 11577]EEI24370.1 DltD C-terminal domain protein [Lentilactobacillus hilgardii DSM 20176 = ATCC 8290]KRK58987.1 D-alanyl transfer protein DltD [Lentilactobacillus hilgardii DSM 20176 = ATCC 8290]MCP9333321.1 D-alanyl-lipoteichoic acid biosynthesis protein DltD [Lentilactobacillus hilgardii]MCP9349930.1 D-alanyl-lipoteichoic acid biosyn
MKVKKRLFEIFGPILFAALLMFAVFLSPTWIKFSYVSPKVQRNAAASLSPLILKGQLIKRSALENNYVPFFGSSEWSRFDPFHPSVLATKYHRSYRPFLLGARGSQSLTQFFVMQSINQQMKNKKAVFFVSPQWFVPMGEDPNAFSFYYSPLQTTTWIQQEKGSKMDRYAAYRLLQMPSGDSDKIISGTLARIAAGLKPTSFQMLYVNYRHRVLLNEDQIYSRFRIPVNNAKKIADNAAELPKTYHFQQLDKLAGQLGAQHTNSNRFQIGNRFWNRRLKHHVKALKGFQSNMSFLKSPEYGDFQLVLNQFAKDHTNVLFIIPPVNQRWQKYTGLSSEMLKQFDQKITYQLRSQGFNHIDDLSQDGNVNYFMTDTIHPGWRGWLKMDQEINPFLTKKQKAPHYRIDKSFYSKEWQQAGSDFDYDGYRNDGR